MEIQTNEKIRVRLESFNHELLDFSCRKIIELVEQNNINTTTMVPLPTQKRIYCVLRSPHVDKDSREHFELRIHKRIVDVYYDSKINIFKVLSESELPSGIFYRISLF
jgi:small subunit ribosomal protein S10